jgi:hypothetical protein
MGSDDAELMRFAENLRQEIINNSESSGDDDSGDSFREDEFTRLMIEYLRMGIFATTKPVASKSMAIALLKTIAWIYLSQFIPRAFLPLPFSKMK